MLLQLNHKEKILQRHGVQPNFNTKQPKIVNPKEDKTEDLSPGPREYYSPQKYYFEASYGGQ